MNGIWQFRECIVYGLPHSTTGYHCPGTEEEREHLIIIKPTTIIAPPDVSEVLTITLFGEIRGQKIEKELPYTILRNKKEAIITTEFAHMVLHQDKRTGTKMVQIRVETATEKFVSHQIELGSGIDSRDRAKRYGKARNAVSLNKKRPLEEKDRVVPVLSKKQALECQCTAVARCKMHSASVETEITTNQELKKQLEALTKEVEFIQAEEQRVIADNEVKRLKQETEATRKLVEEQQQVLAELQRQREKKEAALEKEDLEAKVANMEAMREAASKALEVAIQQAFTKLG